MEDIMRTTINVSDRVMEEIMEYTSARTRTDAVNQALIEWTRARRIDAMRAMRGKVVWEGDLDQIRAQNTPKGHGDHE
jgi:Arc/MetJ family transcription regulator